MGLTGKPCYSFTNSCMGVSSRAKSLNPLNRQPASSGSARTVGHLTPLIASSLSGFCPYRRSLNPLNRQPASPGSARTVGHLTPLIASQPLRVLPGPWVTYPP